MCAHIHAHAHREHEENKKMYHHHDHDSERSMDFKIMWHQDSLGKMKVYSRSPSLQGLAVQEIILNTEW